MSETTHKERQLLDWGPAGAPSMEVKYLKAREAKQCHLREKRSDRSERFQVLQATTTNV